MVRKEISDLLNNKSVRYIAHNIEFDRNFLNSFLSFNMVKYDKSFCTFKFFLVIERNKYITEHVEQYGGYYADDFGPFVYIDGGSEPGKFRFSNKGDLKLETLSERFKLDHKVTHNALDDLNVLLDLLEQTNFFD